MATVTGMTAEAMQAIRDGVIVDAEVVGNNLILTRYDNTTIDAGPVKGPKGDTGPAGISVAQSNLPILDVGISGQIRAGRQLTVADFTRMGLATPIGLFNLSDLSNLGSGGPLSNEGSVPFGVGINGLAATCAVFAGSASQVLYVNDVAGGPYNPRTLSLGSWFRTAKRGTSVQAIAGKSGPGAASATGGYLLYINSNNQLQAWVTNGSNDANAIGHTDICDDRWHFAVMTFDGTKTCLYVDGVIEETEVNFGQVSMIPNQINEPFSIGASDADAASNSNMFWGRIDEVFLTSDVLSEDEVRQLYCAKIAHGASSTPKNAIVGVHRRRKGAPWVAGDFPTLPRRIYNLGSLLDAGADNAALTAVAAPGLTAGADGLKDGAYLLDGSTQYFTAPAAGLPAGTAVRTFGAWIRTSFSGAQAILSIGQAATAEASIIVDSNGLARMTDWTQGVSGPFVADGLWHFVVGVFDPSPLDGLKMKLYVDGRLLGVSPTWGGSGTNATGLYLGREATGTQYFRGAIDGAFIADYALSAEQIRSLYAKGAQDLGVSPKNAGDHVEMLDATYAYVTFDSLESQHLVDLAVAA